MSEEINQIDSEEEKVAPASVLFIDDSKMVRKASMKMLGDEFNVVCAEDGAQGMEMINNDDGIYVVFTDLVMPEMDGFEVIKAIRSHDNEGIRNMPVIVITGKEDQSDELKGQVLELGATDFISKPFNALDLKARARAHANYKRTTDTLKKQITRDSVTGLLDEAAFLEQIDKDLSSAYRHQHDLSFIRVSLDDADALYSKVGNKASESIRKLITKVLSQVTRKEDTLSHDGHANFDIALPHASPQGAVVLAERICKRVLAVKASFKGEVLSLKLSVGVASIQVGYRPERDEVLQCLGDSLNTARTIDRSVMQSFLEGDTNRTSPAIPEKGVTDRSAMAQRGSFTPIPSIEDLLSAIQNDEKEVAIENMDVALRKLIPLFRLASKQQLANLINLLDKIYKL